MVHNNYCNSCELDLLIDGHAPNCGYTANDRRDARSVKLFRDAQFKLARRSHTTKPGIGKLRRSRAQVRVNRVKADGTVDRRRKWTVA